MSSANAYYYLVSFFIVAALSVFFYLRNGLDWEVYVFLTAAVVYLVIFFIKLLKAKNSDSQ
ncbi:hypothetical protein C7S20_01120 [Christiangramia fulva]|uniref:Uncharacterized protein n=1 Tax=Christiangramia fulva TaxID=2126553 RepID=A0A2R3Z148_9FLAO|nr:hypothetical protein [Christiangramia fulva]AVR43976.1 hypothetical protein C7S20_01120 [Christiangramia fulva]